MLSYCFNQLKVERFITQRAVCCSVVKIMKLSDYRWRKTIKKCHFRFQVRSSSINLCCCCLFFLHSFISDELMFSSIRLLRKPNTYQYFSLQPSTIQMQKKIKVKNKRCKIKTTKATSFSCVIKYIHL